MRLFSHVTFVPRKYDWFLKLKLNNDLKILYFADENIKERKKRKNSNKNKNRYSILSHLFGQVDLAFSNVMRACNYRTELIKLNRKGH